MKKFCLFLITALTVSGGLFAQAALEFSETEHDFGEVYEGDVASYEFTFTNTGTEPLVIAEVKASCGCTTPFWTREPVMPGAQGSIKASYNSKGRPGNFRKSIRIGSNDPNTPMTYVYIMGVVVDKPIESYTEEEIAQSPVLTPTEAVFQLGKVENKQAIPMDVTITNKGTSALNISSIRSVCNCFFFDKDSPRDLEAGETTTLKVIYRPSGIAPHLDEFHFVSNDITQKPVAIRVEAQVVEHLNEDSPMKKNSGGFKF